MTEHNIHTRNRNKILRDLTGYDDFIFSAQKIFVTYLCNTDSERRQERRFNRKGVVMNIHRESGQKKNIVVLFFSLLNV